MNDIQLQVLQLLLESGPEGRLQNELAAITGKEPNNFFYVVKGLEERGLVVKRPVISSKKSANSTKNLPVSTNLIHLTKFAPSYDSSAGAGAGGSKGKHAIGGAAATTPAAKSQSTQTKRVLLNEGEDSDSSSSDSSGESGDSSGGEEHEKDAISIRIFNDPHHLSRICQVLQAMDKHVAQEKELKVVLGYVKTRGHRRWRRFRKILVDKGCIEVFSGYAGDGNRPTRLVRLLKPWTNEDNAVGRASAAGDDGNSQDALFKSMLNPTSGRLEIFGNQVAEVSLDRQILKMIVDAGEKGITTSEVDANFRINLKRNTFRLEELQERFKSAREDMRIIDSSSTVKKSIVKRYTATPALIEYLRPLLSCQREVGPPKPPPGGWEKSVKEAISAGPSMEALKAAAEKSAAAVAGGGGDGAAANAAAMDIEIPGDGKQPALGTIGSRTSDALLQQPDGQGKGQLLVGAIASQDASAPQGQQQKQLHPSGQQEEHPSQPVAAHEGYLQPGKLDPVKRRKVRITEIALKREQWLMHAIRMNKLILQAEIPRILQEAEHRAGNPHAGYPDKKIYQRIINTALAKKEIVVLHVVLPGVSGSGSARQHTVLALPGTTIDQPGFIDAVVQRNKDLITRSKSSKWIREHVEQQKGDFPRLEVQEVPFAPVETEEFDDAHLADLKAGGAGAGGGDGACYAGTTAGGDAAGAAGAGDQGPIKGFIKARHMKYGDQSTQSVKIQATNGYITAKMLRMRVVYEAVWDFLSSRNAPCGALEPSILDAVNRGEAFLACSSRDYQMDVKKFQGTEDDLKFVFTRTELWNKTLRVEDLTNCLGSRCTDTALIERLKGINPLIGDLPYKELKKVCGGKNELKHAQGALTTLITTMVNMGLISAVVPCGSDAGGGFVGFMGQNEASAFYLNKYAEFQMPVYHVSNDSRARAAREHGGDANAGQQGPEEQQQQQGTAAASVVNNGNDEERIQVHAFTMTDPDQRDAYWHSMQFLVVFLTRDRASFECSAAAAAATPVATTGILARCFPFNFVKEAGAEKNWVCKTGIDLDQNESDSINSLISIDNQYFDAGNSGGMLPTPSGMDLSSASANAVQYSWEKARNISNKLKIPLEAAIRLMIHHRINGRLKDKKGSSKRLGGLVTGRRGSTARPARKKFAERRKKDEDEEGEDAEEHDSDGDDSHFDDDAGASLPHMIMDQRQYRQLERKKKWYADEDEQLLSAWASWLAHNGGDKILRWKFVRNRPLHVKPVSCRNRLSQLSKSKNSEELRQLMAKIYRVACGVHTRRVLKDVSVPVDVNDVGAAQGKAVGEKGEVAATAATAAMDGDTATEMDAEIQSTVDQEPTLAAIDTSLAGKKRSLEEGSTSHPESHEQQPNVKKPKLFQDPISESFSKIFPVENQEDAQALKEIADAITRIVSIAPNRYSKQRRTSNIATTSGVAGADEAADGSIDLSSSSWVKHTTPALDRLLSVSAMGHRIIVPGASMNAFRLLSYFKRAAKKSMMPARMSTSVPASVAAAMEVIKKLLQLLFDKQKAHNQQCSDGSNGAASVHVNNDDLALCAAYMTKNFTEKEIVAAFYELACSGYLSYGSGADERGGTAAAATADATLQIAPNDEGNAAPAAADMGNDQETGAKKTNSGSLVLGQKYFTETEPLVYPAGIFAKAASRRQLFTGPIHANGAHSASATIPILSNTPLDGSTVAAVLSLLQDPSLDIRFEVPRHFRVRGFSTLSQPHKHQVHSLLDLRNDSGNEMDAQVLHLLRGITVCATKRNLSEISASGMGGENGVDSENAAAATAAAGTAGHGLLSLGAVLQKQQEQEQVLYQPSLLAVDVTLRQSAEENCQKVFADKNIPGGGVACMTGLLHAVRAAGRNGLSFPECVRAVHAALTNADDAKIALSTLCRFGLVRKINGQKEGRFGAVEHTQHLIAFPSLVGSADSNASGAGTPAAPRGTAAAMVPSDRMTAVPSTVEDFMAALNDNKVALQEQGTLQALLDVPLTPWVKCNGAPDESMWWSLYQRAVGTALHCPGISGAVLLQSMRVVSPQFGRDVLKLLVMNGVLTAKRSLAESTSPISGSNTTVMMATHAPSPHAAIAATAITGTASASAPRSVLDHLFAPSDGCIINDTTCAAHEQHRHYSEYVERVPFTSIEEDRKWHFFAKECAAWNISMIGA